MADEANRKLVVFSRRYKCYMRGEVAGFSSKEADAIVAAGFGRYQTKQEKVDEGEGKTKRPKMKRTSYVDRQARSEVRG